MKELGVRRELKGARSAGQGGGVESSRLTEADLPAVQRERERARVPLMHLKSQLARRRREGHLDALSRPFHVPPGGSGEG